MTVRISRYRTMLAAMAASTMVVTMMVGTVPAGAEPLPDDGAGSSADTTTAPVVIPNASFEEWTTPDSWVASNWAMSTSVWVTDAAAHSGTYSQSLNQWNKSATLSQEVAAAPGSYDVSVFVWADGSLGSSRLEANGKSATLESGGATQIDGSKTWDEIVVPGVNVAEDGKLKISIVLDEFPSTLTGFLDDVTVVPARGTGGGSGGDEDAQSFVQEPGFENTGAAWTIGGELASGGHGDSEHAVVHEGATAQDTFQLITGLEDGDYTLTAWVQNTGGQDAAYIYASGTGRSIAKTAIPRTNFAYDAPGTWKKTTLRGIKVTTGEARIGLFSSGGNSASLRVDDVSLVKDTAPYELLIGGDITELTWVEDQGGVYYDTSGRARDAMDILAESGWNIVRIRIYNDPGKGHGDGSYYVPEGYQDVADALRLAKRAKAAGMQIQLSFHYSDYWTNPGSQIIPHAWQELIAGKSDADAVGILESQVHDFTADVLEQMSAQGTAPEYVSLGNETRGGMLFPYGTTGKWDNLARFYNAGAKAVREADPSAKVIIHLDDGGNTSTYRTYFSNAKSRNVDYDIIGTSYYPYWTNKSAPTIATFMTTISQEFGKPIMAMETGFNWTANQGAGGRGQLINNGPYGGADTSTPELQRDFMVDLFNEMQGVPGGMAIGDLYWDPIMLYANGNTGWAYFESDDSLDVNVVDNTTLFDFDGHALPVLNAYRDNTRGANMGIVSGTVVDGAGKTVSGATVTLMGSGSASKLVSSAAAKVSESGAVLTGTTNRYGDFQFVGVQPGEVTVSATRSDLGTSPVAGLTAVAGETARPAVNLVLAGTQSLTTVRGNVVDENGNPVSSASVLLTGTDGTTAASTDATGVFILADVAEGTYKLRISKDKFVTISTEVEVSGAELSDTYTLLENSGSIAGVVRGPGGVPLEGAKVTAGGKSAVTSADGSFEVTGVPVGSAMTVTASKQGYLSDHLDDIEIVRGQVTDELLIELPLIVQIVNPSFEEEGDGGGATLKAWNITSTPDGALYRQDRTSFGGTTDGTYAASFWLDTAYTAELTQHVTNVDPGDYVVHAQVYTGVQGDLTMFVKDGAGVVIAQKSIAPNGGYEDVSIRAAVDGTDFIVGFSVNGLAGDWAVVDQVAVGTFGPQATDDGSDGDGSDGDGSDDGDVDPGQVPDGGSDVDGEPTPDNGSSVQPDDGSQDGEASDDDALASTGSDSLVIALGVASALTLLAAGMYLVVTRGRKRYME